MVEKYIIYKTDIHDLLTGKEIPLAQGRARAFCVEVAGKITNGDMIKAIFPNTETWDESEGALCVEFKTLNQIKIFPKYWWNAPYEKEIKE